MNDPDILSKLQPLDDPVGIAALFQDQLPNAGPEPLQGLGDVRRKPVGYLRQGTGGRLSRVEGEIVEILPCPFDPRNVAFGFAEYGLSAVKSNNTVNLRHRVRDPLLRTYLGG